MNSQGSIVPPPDHLSSVNKTKCHPAIQQICVASLWMKICPQTALVCQRNICVASLWIARYLQTVSSPKLYCQITKQLHRWWYKPKKLHRSCHSQGLGQAGGTHPYPPCRDLGRSDAKSQKVDHNANCQADQSNLKVRWPLLTITLRARWRGGMRKTHEDIIFRNDGGTLRMVVQLHDVTCSYQVE